METISLYDAIREMRRLNEIGESFSFVHATFDRDRIHSDGIRVVRRAKLRPAASKDDVSNADFKLFYFDQEKQLPRVCWQPLIMYFNGIRVTII